MEQGRLVRWNDDKGFGFIKPDAQDGNDVFIHISELKHMARKPRIGDIIMYQTQHQSDGKVRAIMATIQGVTVAPKTTYQSNKHRSPNYRTTKNNKKSHSAGIGRLVMFLVILAIVAFAYKQFVHYRSAPEFSEPTTELLDWDAPLEQQTEPLSWNEPLEQQDKPQDWDIPLEQQSSPSFHCESGKTHCSHMSSCAEATFYIRNCPNTSMDGDGDGIPCERQFCNW